MIMIQTFGRVGLAILPIIGQSTDLPQNKFKNDIALIVRQCIMMTKEHIINFLFKNLLSDNILGLKSICPIIFI